MNSKTVTINLNASHYNPFRPLQGLGMKEGDRVHLAKHLWERTQRTKNKRFVARLLKTKYEVYSLIKEVNTDSETETVLTLTPFKF